jgi:hypothetical protein
MKKDMRSALQASIRDEEKAVSDRFEKAEAAFTAKEEKAVKSKAEQSASENSQSENSQNKQINQKTRPPKPAVKIIRDTFTIPENDHHLIRAAKLRCMRAGVEASKSEIVRAGLKLLAEISDEQLIETIDKLVRLKVGRKSSAS